MSTRIWKKDYQINFMCFFLIILKYNIEKTKVSTRSTFFRLFWCGHAFSFVVVWLFLLFSLTNACSGGFVSSSEGVARIGGQSGVSRRIFSICKWCVPERDCWLREVDDNGERLKLILSFSITYSYTKANTRIAKGYFTSASTHFKDEHHHKIQYCQTEYNQFKFEIWDNTKLKNSKMGSVEIWSLQSFEKALTSLEIIEQCPSHLLINMCQIILCSVLVF